MSSFLKFLFFYHNVLIQFCFNEDVMEKISKPQDATWVSQRFCKILAPWDTVLQLWMLFPVVMKLMNQTGL